MKLRFLYLTIVCLLGYIPVTYADPMQQLIKSLDSEFEAMIPAPSSSVGTDYPTRQAALGSLYTARSLGLIYDQNQEMIARQEALLNRYDRIIEQNKQIIKILTAISERITPTESPPHPPGSPGRPGGEYSD
ncbi:MAG: hypothetical protein JJV98_16070 [Desulfosarcina sp.]|nr:hypothetical protein [Desulfobacterales bacterium]